ncbi:TRAP transporter substrate-binding protein [Hippea alviniae]|uniref:TRAP transporter substrate-binding protein n=1 Tax=Hippea alviniae TaxID=1279027 RepID=UPI0003B72D36|nr:TRAP transporter substrate-binding protein [Hippea alviniae]
MRRGLLQAVMVLLVSLVFVVSSFAKPIIIKFSHVVAVDTPKGKAAEYFAKIVKERTHGKVIVKVYPNAMLYDDRAAIEALQMGAIQMACPATAKFTGWIPEIQLFDLPFLFKNSEGLHKVMDGPVGKKILNLFRRKGLLGLAYWDNGFKVLSNNKHPIVLPKDCKGLKFRIMSSRVLEAQFKALGASPQVLPFSEVYSALEQGVVDGCENPWSNLYTKKFYEVAPYTTETYHGYLGYVLVTNAKFWDSLPPKIRKILEGCVRDATAYERKLAEELAKKQRALVLKDPKVKDVVLTPAQREIWRKTLVKIYPKFYKVIGKDLIEEAIKEQQGIK